jgi:DNA (cytosine-5)-methyltransferase 1
MGLPDGWVTDVPDLSRTQQLTLLGNGVVPAQGAAALAVLFNRLAAAQPTAWKEAA